MRNAVLKFITILAWATVALAIIAFVDYMAAPIEWSPFVDERNAQEDLRFMWTFKWALVTVVTLFALLCVYSLLIPEFTAEERAAFEQLHVENVASMLAAERASRDEMEAEKADARRKLVSQ